MTTSASLRCQCRRKAETSLSCSRCDAPICPDCSVVAPVGMICRACARGGKNLLHQVSPGRFALAAAACLAASLFGGWVLASRVVGFDFMGLWAAFLFGIGIGEIALRITGRKRGRLMEILAGSSVVLGVAGGVAIDLLLHPETAGRAFYLTNPLTYVMLILATISAVGRIRNI